MSFLAINGLTINVSEGGASISRAGFGEDLTRAFSGNLQPERTGMARTFGISTVLETPEEKAALAGLISGQGHHWSFDATLYSGKGLPPNSGYAITMYAGGGKVGGYVSVNSGGTLAYDYTTDADFTMFVWKKEGVNWLQYAYVYDVSAGAATQYKNGAGHTPAGADNITNWYGYSSGTHTLSGKDISGSNGHAPYDELIIVPYAMTETMVAAFYALINGGTGFSSLPRLNMTGTIVPETTLSVVGLLGSESMRTASLTGNIGSELDFDLIEFGTVS